MLHYEREEGFRAWLAHAWNLPDRLTLLMETYGSAERIYDETLCDGGALLREHLPDAQVKRLIRAAEPEAMHRMMVSMREHEIRVISSANPDYPPALAVTDQPPTFLFTIGDPACMRGRCLTVVGARRASPRAISDCRRMRARCWGPRPASA